MRKTKKAVSVRVGQPAKHLQWLRGINPRLKSVINGLIDKWWCRMFHVKGGILYLLVDHHKHQDFRDAKRVKVAQLRNVDEGFYYITETIV